MNIRQKCAAAIALSLAISALLNIAVLRFSVFPSFIELERESAESDIERALAAIDAQLDNLSTSVFDYSRWDESYYFTRDGDGNYVEEILSPLTAENLKVNFIAIYNLFGQPRFEGYFKPGAEEPAPPGDLSLSVLDPRGALLVASSDSEKRGLLMTGRGPLMVASRPVLLSNGEGPYVGTYIMGRYLDEALVAQLNEATHVQFRVLPVGGSQALDAEAGAALERLLAGGRTEIVNAADGTLGVYALLRDVKGAPALLVHATVERGISHAGLRAMLLAVGGIIAAGLVVLAVTVALLQRLLVGPISQLTSHLMAVGSSGDLSRRVGLKRADEIGLLGRQFDDMLEKLAHARSQLLEQSYSAGIAEMAAGVLHNIRNQLAPLSLRLGRLEASLEKAGNDKLARAVEELKSGAGSPERTQKVLQFVELSCKRAAEAQAGMIEEMKSVAQDFVRIENTLRDLDRFSRSRGSLTELRLIEVVRDTVSMLPKYPDIEVVIRIDPALESCPPVAAEPFVLKHVLQNLVVNAIEAMIAAGTSRGVITIRGSVTSHNDRPCVDLQVEDEGIGIEEDRLERIFVRGSSTKAGDKRGTGLHWCATSMLAMGGQIRAESPGPWQGATMHLIIPSGASRTREAA